MEPLWRTLLHEQRAVDFADVAGSQASVVLPISDGLISRLITERLPPSSPIGELRLVAEAGNRMTLNIRLARASFLPAFRIRLQIEHQPTLPSSPVIGFKLMSEGLAALAGSALRFVEFLPRGVSLDGDRLMVNLETMLAEHGAADTITRE